MKLTPTQASALSTMRPGAAYTPAMLGTTASVMSVLVRYGLVTDLGWLYPNENQKHGRVFELKGE